MKSVLSLVRPDILALKAYISARSLGMDGSVFLDANESPRPIMRPKALRRANRYPEPQPRRIVDTAAAVYGVPRKRILVCRGADEGIEVLTRAVCQARRDRILVSPPTYGVYETAAGIQGAGILRVPLLRAGAFALDVPRICDAVRAAKNRIKIVYICSPNNPTGTLTPPDDIAAICRAAAGRALVVVDEAYLEFSGEPSILPELATFPNLVVLKTLSKAWGLAGVRCGFVFADAALINVLQRVRAPYPISSASIEVVEAVFHERGRQAMRRSVDRILAEKSKLLKALAGLPGIVQIYPTQANFLLVRVANKERLLAKARRAGVVVRDRSADEGLLNCIRVTVGTAQENKAVVDCFKEASG